MQGQLSVLRSLAKSECGWRPSWSTLTVKHSGLRGTRWSRHISWPERHGEEGGTGTCRRGNWLLFRLTGVSSLLEDECRFCSSGERSPRERRMGGRVGFVSPCPLQSSASAYACRCSVLSRVRLWRPIYLTLLPPCGS
ncbi:hypothetical protein LIA77_10476 [Sarocladium implicatum]|nr:hypothetical protein LIA77_10476 [Sarocladium implicatum]